MAGWGAVAQIGSDIASSALQAHLSLTMQKRAFKQQNRFYEQRYQRTMKDMRLAGLNPILAYRQGAGAGAPAAGGGGIGGTPQGVGRAVTSSLKFKTELKILKAQRRQIDMSTTAQAMKAHLDAEQAETIRQLRAPTVHSAIAEAKRKRLGLPLAAADAAFYDSRIGKVMRFIDRGVTAISPFTKFNAGPRR